MNISFRKYVVFIIVLSVWVLPAIAELRPSFLQSQTVLNDVTSTEPYLLSLGSLEKINSQWRAAEEQWVSGSARRTTYELKSPMDLPSAWQAVGEHFAALNAELVYACEGLACGSSNAWANERFGVKQLYGLDLSQKYQVWKLKQQRATVLAAVYVVQRGNRRVYAHIDIVTPDDQSLSLPPSASVIAKRFYDIGELTLEVETDSGDTAVIDERYLANVASALNRQPFRRLKVDVRVANAKGEALADQVFAQLLAAGIRERRVALEVNVDPDIGQPEFRVKLAR